MKATVIRTIVLITLLFCVSGIGWNTTSAASKDSGTAQATQAEPMLSEEEMKHFLLTANVIRAKQTSKGITRPSRLTLSDGKITHDALFQPVDERKSYQKLDDGTVEINFRDSYHFNIAAYELAKLLELGYMMPVTVERKWSRKTGSLSWWLKVKMDEKERINKHMHPPDIEFWNNQMHRKRVFAQLVYDTDPNLTNVLIGENWEIYMIDFTRAFRLREDLHSPGDLVRCDRYLLEKLRELTEPEVELAVRPHLSKAEIGALMKRRDRIVAHFEELVSRLGEAEVLY